MSAPDIRAALEALVAKIDEVHAHPAYHSVWMLSHVHGCEYRGPKYDVELEAARSALQAPRPAIHSCDPRRDATTPDEYED